MSDQTPMADRRVQRRRHDDEAEAEVRAETVVASNRIATLERIESERRNRKISSTISYVLLGIALIATGFTFSSSLDRANDTTQKLAKQQASIAAVSQENSSILRQQDANRVEASRVACESRNDANQKNLRLLRAFGAKPSDASYKIAKSIYVDVKDCEEAARKAVYQNDPSDLYPNGAPTKG